MFRLYGIIDILKIDYELLSPATQTVMEVGQVVEQGFFPEMFLRLTWFLSFI